MFFLMGITDGRKYLDFAQTIICDVCGKYGRYQVYMSYTVLTIFFIPCLKWNKEYYVKTSCCDTVYKIDPEIAKRIARGEELEILPKHLTKVPFSGYGYTNNEYSYKKCDNCGYETTQDFEYCPRCGSKLNAQ